MLVWNIPLNHSLLLAALLQFNVISCYNVVAFVDDPIFYGESSDLATLFHFMFFPPLFFVLAS